MEKAAEGKCTGTIFQQTCYEYSFEWKEVKMEKFEMIGVSLLIMNLMFLSGCGASKSCPEQLFLRAQPDSEFMKLHPTSIFELKRCADDKAGYAFAAFNRMKEKHQDNQIISEEMEISMANLRRATRMEMEQVEEWKGRMEENDSIFWFEHEKKDEIEIGRIILSPNGQVKYREVEVILNK